MGSMGKRRGRRTRSDEGGSRRNLEQGFPRFQHDQWTFEGQMERLGAFARGVNRRKRDVHARPLGRSTPAQLVFRVLGLLLLLTACVYVVGLLLTLLVR